MIPARSGERLAVYPGSFDPITNGHLDIVERGLGLFDRVIFAIAPNENKRPLFTAPERAALAQAALAHHGDRVTVTVFNGLLVDFVKQVGALAVIRGLRVASDFEFELQLALMNRSLAPDLEMLFLMPKHNLIHLSSSLVKEMSRLGGDVAPFVPQNIPQALHQKFHP